MRCGTGKNKCLPELFKVCFVFLISLNGALLAACQSKPNDAAAILQPCRELIDKDDLQAAGKCYEKALAANPKQADEIEESFSQSFFKKCLEFKEAEKHEKAIVCLEGLGVLAPDSGNVQLQLADAYYHLSKTTARVDLELLARAEKAVEKSLEINSGKAMSYETYGEILESKGDLREALKAHQQALKLEPNKERFLMNIALVQEKFGDSSLALTSYYQVLQLNPKNALALYNSAKLYEQTGNKEQAIKNYEKLLEIKGEYDDTRERLENLKKPKQSKIPEKVIIGVPNSP